MRGRADAAKQMSISGRAEEHQSAWRQRMSIMSISSGGRRAKQISSGGRRAKQEHPGHQQRREEGIMNISSGRWRQGMNIMSISRGRWKGAKNILSISRAS